MNDSTNLSPCIKVCSMDDDTGFCLGCARSLPEVARWRSMSREQQKQVLALLPARKEAMREAGADTRWRE